MNKFIRMDRWGIYGYIGNDNKTFYPKEEDEIIEKAVFSSLKIISSCDYEKLNTKDKYSFYLDGNHSLVHINTNLNPNDNLLVIKANKTDNIQAIKLEIYVFNPLLSKT